MQDRDTRNHADIAARISMHYIDTLDSIGSLP
jgi:hypothetical protein